MTAPAPAGVTAAARITAVRGGALPVLESDGPLALRRTRASGPYTQVTMVGAMSVPLGGDRLRVTVRAGAGAALRVTSVASMVALPGPDGGAAEFVTELSVGDGAELHWLPEPLISARGSELRMTTRIRLAATARLVFREEQVLGRAGEEPGRLSSRLTVHHAGRPLLDQELSYGPGVPGWDGAAVLGGCRAAGQLLVAGPEFREQPVEPVLLGGTAVRTPLAGPASLVTAVAPDALELRRLLDRGGA
ncbi:urease accessory protein UreD [Streptomyces sp. ACA25]|uniref:urease accessory protein UreD n=1 Tax=Streptomyces sp. ACA25 TaxID=3022596 RepID=UPI0023082E88|nr:urease accessory protein UreD [Streptomyces sp. ACA25]MDB1089100.1 urease accessory protein UreD [Streptomyces sp. ACA25]